MMRAMMAFKNDEMGGVTVTPPATYSNREAYLTSPAVLETNDTVMPSTIRGTSAVNPQKKFTQNPYTHSSFHQGANR
jgi:hypothetical protein